MDIETKEIKDDSPVKTPEQALEELKANPEVKKGALHLAFHIQENISRNWFSIQRLCAKTGMSRNEAIRKIHILRLFNLVQIKQGQSSDGKKVIGVLVFKVTVSLEDRISALDQMIGYHQEQIANLQTQKHVLLNSSTPSEKN